MDEQQAGEAAARVDEVAAPVNAEQVHTRSLTSSAMQMMAQAAELAGAGVVTGAAVETGRRLVGQAFDRPDASPPPQIEVEQGYRPKED